MESTAGSSPALADRILRDLRVRGTSVSTYCAGLAVALPELPGLRRPVLKRRFVADGTLPAAA